jgi:hypothetical protein
MQFVVMNGYSSKWSLCILSMNEFNESIELVILDYGGYLLVILLS